MLDSLKFDPVKAMASISKTLIASEIDGQVNSVKCRNEVEIYWSVQMRDPRPSSFGHYTLVEGRYCTSFGQTWGDSEYICLTNSVTNRLRESLSAWKIEANEQKAQVTNEYSTDPIVPAPTITIEVLAPTKLECQIDMVRSLERALRDAGSNVAITSSELLSMSFYQMIDKFAPNGIRFEYHRNKVAKDR